MTKYYIEYIEQVGYNPPISKAKIEKSDETIEELLAHAHVTYAVELANNVGTPGEVLANGDIVDENGEVVGSYIKEPVAENKETKKSLFDKK